MKQDKMWDYYQAGDVSDDLREFLFPDVRQRYVLRYLKPRQLVLNIGVGSGALERLGIDKGVNMHSLDPSQKIIERLRTTMGMADKAKVGYIQSIPFDDEYFDVVVLVEVLEHLDNDILAQGLREVIRILKRGGMLVATTPYREDLSKSIVVCPECEAIYHRFGHVQSFDKIKMRHLLQSVGFEIVSIRIDAFADWRKAGLKNKAKCLVKKLLAKIGESIADPHLMIQAKKP